MKFIIDIPEEDFYSIRSGALYAIGHDKYDCIVTDAFKQGTPYEDRPKGEWINHRTIKHDGEYYCSNCDFELESNTEKLVFNFCPNCGARMI